MKREAWIELANDYVASVGLPRKRRGTQPPPRVLVLGPLPTGRMLRPIVASADIIDGAVCVDFGVLSTTQLAELEAKVRALPWVSE